MPIVSDPKVRSGVLTFQGTRIPVYVVFSHLEDGYTVDQILTQFPRMTRENVAEAFDYIIDLLANPPKVAKTPLLCRFGFHRYREVNTFGVNRYRQCRVCGKRIVIRGVGGCGSPVDYQWLETGEWSNTQRPAPPKPQYRRREMQN